MYFLEIATRLCQARQWWRSHSLSDQLITLETVIATSKPSILIVDDDEDFMKSLSRLIASWDVAVVYEAVNGEDALGIVDSDHSIGLILSDYMMPEMDGLTMKEHLNSRPETASIPTVMISGYGTPQLQDMAASCGISEWHDKPIDSKVVKATVAKHLGLAI